MKRSTLIIRIAIVAFSASIAGAYVIYRANQTPEPARTLPVASDQPLILNTSSPTPPPAAAEETHFVGSKSAPIVLPRDIPQQTAPAQTKPK